MAVLALVGITGMYLRQVRRIGVLGLVGYLLLSRLPAHLVRRLIAARRPPDDRRRPTPPTSTTSSPSPPTAARPATSACCDAQQVQGLGYLLGGLVFGIALYRAGVLARWASALLAVGGVVTIALSVMPDAFYRGCSPSRTASP